MVMRKMALAVTALAVIGCSCTPPSAAGHVAGSARPLAGPSARQLAAGRWREMPAAPTPLCGPLSAWDGRDLVVVEPGLPTCLSQMRA